MGGRREAATFLNPMHTQQPQEKQEFGLRDALSGLARAGARYLGVRGRLTVAEAGVEFRFALTGMALLAGALLAALTATLALAASLYLGLESLIHHKAGAALLTAAIFLPAAYLLGRSGLRRLTGHTYFPTLRSELNRDIQCLNSTSNPSSF